LADLKGKTLLITGGTGSFGRAMVDLLLNKGLREIRIFSRDELKQEQMRVQLDNARVKFHIGDVRSPDSVDAAMRGVDYVFHAAALKQVPSCEFFPMEAVYTNVIGSHHIIESARRHGVRRVVCLSTDKAVYPINAMGMTKALMEKVVYAAARTETDNATAVVNVRYGNVTYSRGSVIPLFVTQIKGKQPITVTDLGMTRFLLPLGEAIELVMFALQRGRPGDTFIRKAPACTLGNLVTALQNVFGTRLPVKVIGVRHGEKIFETLASREELRRAQDLGGYYRVRMDDRDLNYNKYFTVGDTKEAAVDDYTSHNTHRLDVEEVTALLMRLPEIKAELAGWNKARRRAAR
jgi:UDP-N-acetylglucosamine 4,6-dehydratase/5-epimerase